MDDFDDFDIGPQADEFEHLDEDIDYDVYSEDDDIVDEEDDLIYDENDLRPYSREWFEENDDDGWGE